MIQRIKKYSNYIDKDVVDVVGRLGSHEGFQNDGFTVTMVDGDKEIAPGISVKQNGSFSDKPNLVIFEEGDLGVCDISFSGGGSVVVLQKNAWRRGKVVIRAGNNLVISGADAPQPCHFSVNIHDEGSTVSIGSNTSSNGLNIACGGGKDVVLGRDCLLSWGIVVRSSDIHSIFSLDELEILNGESNVLISDHVWIGPDVLINKGVRVDRGAIIAAKSVVVKNVPAFSLVAGAPSSVKKENVSWARKSPARVDKQDLDFVVSRYL